MELVPCSASHTSCPGGRHIYHRMGQVQVPPSSARVSCSRGRIHQSLWWYCCRCPTEGQNSGWYSSLGQRRWTGILTYSALHRPLCPQWHCFQPHQVPLRQGHCELCWVHVDPCRNGALQPDAVCYPKFSCAHRHHWGSIMVRPHQPGRLQSCDGPSDATLQGTAEVQYMVLGCHTVQTIWRFSQVNPWQDQRRCLCIRGRLSYMPEYRLEQEWYCLHTAAEDMLLWHPWCCPDGWRLVLAGSRFTLLALSRYAPIEGEALAVTYGLEKCRLYVMGCPNLIVAVDHASLVKLLGDWSLNDIPNPRLLRLKEKTLPFSYSIKHVKWTLVMYNLVFAHYRPNSSTPSSDATQHLYFSLPTHIYEQYVRHAYISTWYKPIQRSWTQETLFLPAVNWTVKSSVVRRRRLGLFPWTAVARWVALTLISWGKDENVRIQRWYC